MSTEAATPPAMPMTAASTVSSNRRRGGVTQLKYRMTSISWDDMSREVTEEEYQRILRLRDGLRQFLDWSGRKAVAAGITPAQQQLLLVIRAHLARAPPLPAVAEHLLTRNHRTAQPHDRA